MKAACSQQLQSVQQDVFITGIADVRTDYIVWILVCRRQFSQKGHIFCSPFQPSPTLTLSQFKALKAMSFVLLSFCINCYSVS